MASVELYRGEPGMTVKVQEATGGSANDFYAGDLVKTDSSGQLVIADAGNIFGIAQSTALGDDGYINVQLINPNATYKCYYHSDATAATLIGDCADFTFTPGAHVLEESGATTDVLIVDLIDAAGTAGGALEVRFMPTAYDTNR